MKIGKIAAGLIAIALMACVVRDARAQTPEQEQAAQDLRDADAVCKRHRAELMKIPHVKNVTGEVDGQNEAAILVEVDDQKNIDAVTRQCRRNSKASRWKSTRLTCLTRSSDSELVIGATSLPRQRRRPSTRMATTITSG